MGWIKLDRKLLESWVWTEGKFSKGQAWVDLLLLANHKKSKGMHRGKMKVFEAGCVYRSVDWLSKRWGWTWRTTKKYLEMLEADGMITLKCRANDTVIIIEKWALYQGRDKAESRAESIAEDRAESRAEGRHTRSNKEIYKEDKEEGANAPTSDEEEYENDWEWEDP